MLRLVLQWFARSAITGHELSLLPNARWFSEARLASPFLPRFRGDKLAEGYTHADGVIGHFRVGQRGLAELSLEKDAQQFVVIEAKMFSGLSKGTTRAPTYNQAARTVACMAEICRRSDRIPTDFTSMGFLILAPKSQIERHIFSDFIDKISIQNTVQKRAAMYNSRRIQEYEKSFLLILQAILIKCRFWEDIILYIKCSDSSFGNSLEKFYELCTLFDSKIDR